MGDGLQSGEGASPTKARANPVSLRLAALGAVRPLITFESFD